MGGTLTWRQIKIANGATNSEEVDLREHRIVGIQIATITGATFSFLGRPTDQPVKNSGGTAVAALTAVAVVDNAGNAISITATDDRFITWDEEPLLNLAGVPFLTFVSAGAEGADRFITLALERRI